MMVDKSKIVKELNNLYTNKLRNPFPYRDTEKILENFRQEFSLLSDDFNPDFNNYCMTIAGSISYVIAGKVIPQQQASLLRMDFFERFPIYKFLESCITDYPTFNEEYTSFEKARKLLLEYLN